MSTCSPSRSCGLPEDRYYIRHEPFFRRSSMRSLPLFKFGSRASSTSWGIALCTMFIVASFSIASGLETSMDKLAGNFSSDRYLLTIPGESGPSYFSQASLDPSLGDIAIGAFTTAFALPYNQTLTIFSISDPYRVLTDRFVVGENQALIGNALPQYGQITLMGDATVSPNVTGRYSSTIFPSSWILIDQSSMMDLKGLDESVYNFAVSESLNETQMSALQRDGFNVQPLVGIVDFLDSGVKEIKSDATWVLVPSAFVIAVLAYSFIGTETADKRHDIGIVKTLGAGRKRVLSYLLLNALIISSWGGLLGVSLGVVLSYALSTAASAMFTSFFVIETSEMLLVISFLATVGAGVLGALIPSLRMTFTSPVQDLREGEPFS